MFPEKTKWFKINIGWQDLGEVNSVYNPQTKCLDYDCHLLCKTIINIGKENGEVFRFCPRCLIKLK